MTSIATKGGAVIVKDGKAAEGCGCCGGWYCDRPASFAATVSLNLGSAIYTVDPPGAKLPVARITSQYAAAISTTYQLDPLGNCGFGYVNFTKLNTAGGFPSEMPFADSIIISLSAGASCGAQMSVQVSKFALWINADSTLSGMFVTDNPINDNTCGRFSSAWANASGKTFYAKTNGLPTFYFPTTKQLALAGCNQSAYYSTERFSYGGFSYALSGGSQAAKCVDTLDGLDVTWTYDVLYIDTSGSSPQDRVLSSALSLRVQAVT
jgi:hypothetical protein